MPFDADFKGFHQREGDGVYGIPEGRIALFLGETRVGVVGALIYDVFVFGDR